MSVYDAPLDPASVLGDDWVARIRAEHERLGIFCPCGNSRPAIDYSQHGALPADIGLRRSDVTCVLPRRD